MGGVCEESLTAANGTGRQPFPAGWLAVLIEVDLEGALFDLVTNLLQWPSFRPVPHFGY